MKSVDRAVDVGCGLGALLVVRVVRAGMRWVWEV